jgi:hypothetical protein
MYELFGTQCEGEWHVREETATEVTRVVVIGLSPPFVGRGMTKGPNVSSLAAAEEEIPLLLPPGGGRGALIECRLTWRWRRLQKFDMNLMNERKRGKIEKSVRKEV